MYYLYCYTRKLIIYKGIPAYTLTIWIDARYKYFKSSLNSFYISLYIYTYIYK